MIRLLQTALFSGKAGDDRFQPMRVTVSKSFAVAWVLTLAMLITSLGQAPQPNDPPLDPATVREQATLPPGYTVFSVDAAERSARTIHSSNAFRPTCLKR